MASPWFARALELLADREWHERDQLLEGMAALIPPGKAYRRGERGRVRQRLDPLAVGRARGDDSTAIAAGARELARGVLTSAVARGRLERDGDRYRLRAS